MLFLKNGCSLSLAIRTFIVLILFSSCNQKKLFTLLDPADTGVTFVNKVTDSDTLNILDYVYFYNGGGVSIGDINNDGLQDIYFSSNQGSNKLYLNKGNFKFEDITDKAGVAGKGNWKTGVTMADVNGDGLLDIYVCEVGKYKSLQGRNELFINNGNLTFTEKANEYGLAVEGFNTQVTFLDYDHDGDLDMFLVNHSVHSPSSYYNSSQRLVHDEMSGDKLFRNDSTQTGRKFIEVTQQAGIYSSNVGYGLNVITGDFNNDGWDDIYVSNDFHENDYYYINNHDGTFSERNQQAFGHESRFSMGSDVADVNNDGWLDLITLDMLPPDEKVLKSSVSDDPPDIFQYKLNYGYHYQYSRNCLQLNVDGGKKFSEIGLFAGVAATDWSWSPLLADFNNDGIKDLFISNGIARRPNDLDYLKFTSRSDIHNALQHGKTADSLAIEQMPPGKISNYIFSGSAQVTFTDETKSWGFEQPTLSNGCAYADLDNDGDLDLVINNMNSPASIYKNNANEQTVNHFINISLKGLPPNTFAYGTKILISQKGRLQMGYVTATKGFESSSTQTVHFGLGTNTVIDSLEVIWPDNRSQLLIGVKADQLLRMFQQNAIDRERVLLPSEKTPGSQKLFTDITDSVNLQYRHTENDFTDFNFQAFIPHKISTQGPKIAVADVNGDGLDDFFVCGARYQPGKLFLQTKAGKFVSASEAVFAADSVCEGVNATFFDADGDGDKDLYVVSGGNETLNNSTALLDRLYMNDGKGNFIRSDSLPSVPESKSVAIAADIDHDGDLDLFVGGRVVDGRYGLMPRSYILLNDGKGKFSFAPGDMCKDLQNIGMVTDATWTDIDKDGWKDLVIVGEWMPVTVFKNSKGKLINNTRQLNLSGTGGWWTSIKSADVNGDGNEDLLVGNWGQNTKFHASESFPLKFYVGDIDNNGALDQLLAVEKHGSYYPFLGKEDMEKQLPAVFRKKYPDYKSLAGQTMEQIFGNTLENTVKLSAATLTSKAFINTGKGNYSIHDLPVETQWSPVFGFVTGDFNHDGITDILSVGNFYGAIPYEGRYDASYGTVLLGRGDGLFKALSPLQSGLIAEGDVRDIKAIRSVKEKVIYAIARNNDTILFYENK